MAVLTYDNDGQRQLLTTAKVIAVVGHSDRPYRTSYQIARFLRRTGYTVYAVNPTITEIDGESSYPSLAAVPEPIDIVDVFRRSAYLPEVVDEAIAVGARCVWAQLGVFIADEAVQRALNAGLDVIMDTCIKVSYARLIRV